MNRMYCGGGSPNAAELDVLAFLSFKKRQLEWPAKIGDR